MSFDKAYYIRGVELFGAALHTGGYAHAKLHLGPLWIAAFPPWGLGAEAKTVFEITWVRKWYRPMPFMRDVSGWIG